MTKKQEWVPEVTLAEMIKEEPIESRFTYGDWMMHIKPDCWLLWTYKLMLFYNNENIPNSLAPVLSEWADNNCYMIYTFKSFEEAYEGMLSFLESIKK